MTSFTFDLAGNRTSVTDPLGRTTTTTYGAQNRVLAQTLPDPDGAGALSAPVTQFAYDLAGRLTSLIDPAGNETSYTFDLAGRLTLMTDALDNAQSYVYNPAGELTAVTDRNGRTRTFSYNDLGLRTSEVWLDSENDPVRTMTWAYDDAGRLVTASDPDSTYAYTYDDAGQVTSVANTGTPGVPELTLNFAYDYAGNRTSVDDSDGGYVAYTYTDHRLARLDIGVAAVTFDYDEVGRLTEVGRTLPTGTDQVRTQYEYDDLDRLTGITHESVIDQQATTLSEFSYVFDAASQITSYTGPEGTLNYTYDFTGQLLSVSGARSESYSYDENGNRTMTGYETGDANRLLSDGVYDYEYDDEGNMTAKERISDGQRTEYEWDYRNRMTRVVVKDAQNNVLHEEVYTYDIDNRRIGVSVDADGEGSGEAVQRWTVYDGVNPYADFDDEGNLTNRYLYGLAIDQLFARVDAEGEVDWYLGDYLGSVRQIVETDGTVLDEIDYDSFGQVLSETNSSEGDRFKYTAREWDEVGQYFYRARYYGANVGRFLSQDPLRFAAGDSNLYRYVFNAATNATDPSGLDAVWYNPFTWGSEEWEAFGGSLYDSYDATTSGLAGIYLWAIGDPMADELLDHSGRVGPFGQTANDSTGWFYYGTRGAILVSAGATCWAGGIILFKIIQQIQSLYGPPPPPQQPPLFGEQPGGNEFWIPEGPNDFGQPPELPVDRPPNWPPWIRPPL